MNHIIIIGGGPAGISAAFYTARAGIKTTVIDIGGSALRKATIVDNYFGAPSLDGEQILQTAIDHAKSLGVQFINEEVVGIEKQDGFIVQTTNATYSCGAVLLATGSQRKSLKVQGLSRFEGAGVSYCAVCDGFFFRGKSVAVVGKSGFALHEYDNLKDLASKVVLLTHNEDFQPTDGYNVITKKIKSVYGGDTLEGVEFEDGEKLPLDGLFIAYGDAAANAISRQLGIIVENGIIKTDRDMRTNIEGIYAAGDNANPYKQLSIAVGEGARAALNAIKYLKGK